MKTKHIIIILFALSCFVFFILYRNILFQATTNHSKPYIVCTTTIIGDTIKAIAADSVRLEILMGPGVDPHIYKPIEKDLIKIAKADLVVYHGLHLEARMADLFEHLNSMKPTLAATKDIPRKFLIPVDKNQTVFDPHVWFDPRAWIYVVQTITKQLCLLVPQEASVYNHNKNVFISRIEQMYLATKEQLKEIKQPERVLITSHDAFSYFARAYSFKVISLQGINTACEAGINDVQKIVQLILQHHIPTIFIESSVPPRSMHAIQERVAGQKGKVSIGKELFSDSLGNIDTPEGTYLGMLNYNIDAILQGLTK